MPPPGVAGPADKKDEEVNLFFLLQNFDVFILFHSGSFSVVSTVTMLSHSRRAKSGVKMCHFVMVDLNKHNAFVISLFPALFYMLKVDVHLRMREICQQICASQKTIILIRSIQSFFYFIVIIVKQCAEKWYHLLY